MTERGIEGAVVVLDTRTGGVLALHSTPSYDPNKFVDGLSKDYWDELLKHPNNPLINNAIANAYPPGSTFKLVTALAGLESGISPNQHFYCNGFFTLGSRVARCWNPKGHGAVNCVKAIAQSCNPYFYNVALQIGIDKIAKTAKKLGMGDRTGIELPNENNGIIPDNAWKKKRFKLPWYPGDTVNACIGQGYVLTTPLQIAVMTARIASGKQLNPHLKHSEDTAIIENLDFSERNLALVKEGMFQCANVQGGIVFHHQMSIGDFKISGKTGTSQVVALKNKAAGKKFKNHALFTSFAPYENPRFVVTVIVEHGEGGSRAAAPIAKEVYKKLVDFA